jgi:hypothetical protein
MLEIQNPKLHNPEKRMFKNSKTVIRVVLNFEIAILNLFRIYNFGIGALLFGLDKTFKIC